MHIAYFVDYRSPLCRPWIAAARQSGFEVTVISSTAAGEEADGSYYLVPPAGSASLRGPSGKMQADRLAGHMREIIKNGPLLRLLTPGKTAWQAVAAATSQRRQLTGLLARLRPDLVHAMRIPFEAVAAAPAAASLGIPAVVSVWGNDFTLFASQSRLCRHLTRQALTATAALHADCFRDIRLAAEYGWDSQRPSLVAPGGGGIERHETGGALRDRTRNALGVGDDDRLIINARGIRNYARQEEFLAAMAHVLTGNPGAKLLCTGLHVFPPARTLRDRFGESRVILTPPVGRETLLGYFAASDVFVSPTTHDGTPNTLLEAMSEGSLPVVSDIESLREWVTHEENGLIFDPLNISSIAAAVERAVNDEGLRLRAAMVNRKIIAERAGREETMRRMHELYRTLAGKRRQAA